MSDTLEIDLKGKRVGLDIDGVLANFPAKVIERAKELGLEEYFPDCCHGISSWDISSKFQEVMKDAWEDPEFWLTIKPMDQVMPVMFQPTVYVTSRPISTQITERWLNTWYFPKAKVISVKTHLDKLSHIVDEELDLFVDDYYETVSHLRKNGVNALLYKANYQRGHKEECKNLPIIHSLEEIVNYV